MSKRIDIKGKIFTNVLVLEYHTIRNTHAIWKCKCLRCNEIFYPTYSNLKSGNTKSCSNCSKKRFSIETENEIREKYNTKKYTIVKLAKIYQAHSQTISRIVRQNRDNKK